MSIKAMQDALEAMDNRDYKLADQILCQAIEDAAMREPLACVIDGKLMAYKNGPLPNDCLLYDQAI